MYDKTGDSGDSTVPDPAPPWSELFERAPYDRSVRDDPSGGVIVHRCHPSGNSRDFFVFGTRHETMKGNISKGIKVFGGPGHPYANPSITQWTRAVESFHVRAGSHEDCPVCQGTADPTDLLAEIIEAATEQVGGENNVAQTYIGSGGDRESGRAVVYLDSHGAYSSGGTYSVRNTTVNWAPRIEAHPYVQMVSVAETRAGGSTPDDALRIELKTWYPDTTPAVVL